MISIKKLRLGNTLTKCYSIIYASNIYTKNCSFHLSLLIINCFFFATHYLDRHRYIMILVEKGTIKARSQRTDKNSQTWTAAAKKSLATARAEQQTVMSINQLQAANLCEYLCTCMCVGSD